MELSSFFFYLLFFSPIFQLSNTIVSSTKVEIPAQDGPTDKLDSLIGRIPNYNSFTPTFNNSHPTDVDIGKRLVQHRIKRDNDDAVYFDHREFGCIPEEPRSQGNCLAGYAFATIAFYEWLHCMKTREYLTFSEQYIVDCGYQHGTSGCNGGNLAAAKMFVDNRGLILRRNYAYTGEEGDCPYDDSYPDENVYPLYIEEDSVDNIPLDELVEYIEFGPIVVTIEISDEFIYYSGGVDDNEGHDPGFLHTMLLIGHGREDGKDYWLFRNSLPTYDQSGLYKLNKDADCFEGEFGIGLTEAIFG